MKRWNISGDDATALDFMQLGGQGVISVTANIAAKEMTTMCSYALKGDFENAILNYKKAILIKPNYIDALNNIGNTFHRLGQTSEAIDNLKKVILLDPSNTIYWNNIAYPMRSIDKLLANNILLDLQKEKKLLPQEININILKYKIFRSVNISDDFFNLLIESFAKVQNSISKL